ncbi:MULTISPECIES: Cof-type HAD-IIB family hydrolase [Microbacterium]|uniref:HAD family hydrolase n=1 Tax=Microbacterium wangchenii TaxID=2541726 RepID=A0ABX5SMP5_9MICO|nr:MULTISPECIES: Cof-type HAD-IIB family hydrolase [Microbacterium]MCK6066438.1 Cof-type HAD-IIB family hydrolase [Microbacterium sp. EYE_512]QBR87401.1 HAD family hydrolase [Microbacterium wangchenii]TXK14723.1 HAD family hydrolase [Microbacterium wangchenii]
MSSADPRVLDAPPRDGLDIRLVAVDMDGTLLDGEGRLPPGFDALLEHMLARGIVFTPASGRQYATLRREFGASADDLAFIAENGTIVMRDGVELSSDVMDSAFVQHVLARLREVATRHDIGVVVCGKRSAYIERRDPAFVTEAERYYAELARVDDLTSVDDDVLKVAVYAFESAEESVYPELADIAASHQVVVSGRHWVDIMNSDVNKGTALRRLQETLGITREQTVAFGDYLNDLELLDAAAWSYAMANAHDEVAARARFRAPANTEYGVVTVLTELLGP